MGITPWATRFGRAAAIGGSLNSEPITSEAWVTPRRFKQAPPQTSGEWYAGLNFDADVTPGTVGEVRLRTTDSTGATWVTDPVQFSDYQCAAQTLWVRVQGSGGTSLVHTMEAQVRRVSGAGSVLLHDARAGFISTPEQPEQQPVFSVDHLARNSGYGEGPQTVANPALNSGNTFIVTSVAPGPGYDLPTVGSAVWTEPDADAVLIGDYEVGTGVGVDFVHRVRFWRIEENGQASFTAGLTNNGIGAQERRQTLLVHALDRTAGTITVHGPEVDANPSTPYPQVTVAGDHMLIAVTTSQNNDELTSDPAGYTQRFSNMNRAAAGDEWRLLEVHTRSPAPAGLNVLADSTWTPDVAAHVNFLLTVAPASA